MSVFPPDSYGSVFHVIFHRGDSKTKEGIKGHVIITKDSASILSQDWKSTLATIPVTQVHSNEQKGEDVYLHTRLENRQTSFIFECHKADKLVKALTPVPEKQKKDVEYLSAKAIMPTFQDIKFNQILEAAAQFTKKFFTPFGSKQLPPNVADMIVCMYRARFPNSMSGNLQRNIDLLLTSLRREFLQDWCIALVRSCKFKVEPNAFEYFVRIIVNSASDIAIVAEGLQTNCTDLLTSIAQMSETGDAAPIVTAAEQIRAHIAVAVEQAYKDAPPQNVAFSDLMMKITLVLFCGIMVQIFQADIDKLSKRAVEFCYAVSHNKPTDDPLKFLKKALDSFANELLRFMDAKRYDAEFHYVFVAFTIVEDIRRMKFDFGF